MKFLLCKNWFMILPNFIEAENPFPVPFPLAKNSMNTWLPRDLNSDEVIFPVIELNWLSLELPPSYMFKKSTLVSSYKYEPLWNQFVSKKFQDIFTSKTWKLIDIVLPTEAVIIQVQYLFGYLGDAKRREVVFNHSEQFGSIGILLKYALNPRFTSISSVMNCIVMCFPVPEIVFLWLLKL